MADLRRAVSAPMLPPEGDGRAVDPAAEGMAGESHLGIVRALLASGERQLARAAAHAALWDARTGPGAEEAHAGCSLVALAEGFDELAAVHWARVHSPALRRALWPHGLRLAWRQGGEAAALDAIRGPWPDVAGVGEFLREAWAIGRHREAATGLVHAGVEARRIGRVWLEALGKEVCRLDVPGDGAYGPGAPPMVLALPPFPLDGLVVEGRRVLAPRWAAACAAAFSVSSAPADPDRRSRYWVRRWRALTGRATGLPLVPADATSAAALSPDRRALILEGTLTHAVEAHWHAVLSQMRSVVVLGLQVHDPSALTGRLVEALVRHQPIGVRDTASELLLREAGVEAGQHGAASEPERAGAKGLWTSSTPVPLPAQWCAAWKLPAVAPPCGTKPRRPAGPQVATTALPHAVHVACAVDSALAPMLPVMVQSCLDHLSRPLHVHVLTRGVDVATIARWQRLFDGQAHIEAHACDGFDYGAELHLLAHTSVSTLDRLRLPDLLPQLPRALYLDLDLVVLADLAPLWVTDLRGCALAAKPSTSPGTRYGTQMLYQALGALPPELAQARRRELHAGGPMSFRAFNAGVLLLDLDRLRRDGAVKRLLDFVSRFAMNDQDALNAYVRDDYLPLDIGWNAAPRQDPTDGARIVHFVGPVKPWDDIYIGRREAFLAVEQRVRAKSLAMGL